MQLRTPLYEKDTKLNQNSPMETARGKGNAETSDGIFI